MWKIKLELILGPALMIVQTTCAMIYEVEDEKLISVKGNKDHPMTRALYV